MILCIANNKGGVAKTATSVEVAAALARRGRRVLLVDMDPQGSASAALRLAPAPGRPSLGEVLLRRATAASVVAPSNHEALHVLPSTLTLAAVEANPGAAVSLGEALEPVESDYDVIVVDTQPSLGPLLTMALVYADQYLVPVSADWQSARALAGFMRQMAEWSQQYPDTFAGRIGVLVTRYDTRTRESRDIENDIRAGLGPEVLATVVRDDVALKRAAKYGQAVGDLAPDARAAEDYEAAVDEIINRLNLRGYAV